MTPKFNKSNFLLPLFVAMLIAFNHSALAQQAPVVVKTYGQHVGGNIVYHHEVTNNGSRNVSDIAIGLDTNQISYRLPPTREQGELNFVMPVGSDMSNLKVNSASVSGPNGWTAEIIQIEHTGRFMQWYSPGYPQPSIQPGQTFRFTVTVPGIIDDAFLIKHFSVGLSDLSGVPSGAAYLTGHFQAQYADGQEPMFYNGRMEKLDITPPTLTIKLSPATLWPPNDKLVSVTAAITVKDDYDPQPEIKLLSISANEPLDKDDIKAQLGTDARQFQLKAERDGKNKTGRIYTVTYSATDGSGNKSIASATVTVPHDEREHEGSDKKRDHHDDKDKNDGNRSR